MEQWRLTKVESVSHASSAYSLHSFSRAAFHCKSESGASRPVVSRAGFHAAAPPPILSALTNESKDTAAATARLWVYQWANYKSQSSALAPREKNS